MMLTRDQEYALDVHGRVSKIASTYQQAKESQDKERFRVADEARRNYGAMCHKLPILIRSAGLIQALTFVASRDKKIYEQLLTDLAGTVGKQDKEALLARARSADLREYIYLTQRVLTALLWYKRCAQSILGVDASTDSDEGSR